MLKNRLLSFDESFEIMHCGRSKVEDELKAKVDIVISEKNN